MIRWFSLVTLAALGACGSGSSGDPSPTTPTPPSVISVAIAPATVTLAAVGQTAALTAAVVGTAGAIGSPTVTWASSAPAVAAVTSTGASSTVTAVGPGTAQITATSGGVVGTATVTVSVPATPAIALATTPVSIVAGGNASVDVQLSRTNFSGAVALAINGAPAGVTTTVASVGDRFTVAIAAAPTSVAGSYTLTAVATGNGVPSVSAAIPLTITAPAGSIALSVSPATLSVVSGSNTSATISVARTNVTGTVSLAVSGAPAGVTANVSPSTTTGSTATLSVQVAAGTAPGSATLTITAVASGAPSASIAVPLTVQASGTGGANTTVIFCGQTPAVPIWVAAEDASGRWQRLQPVATNTYRFNRTRAEGLAYVMSTAPGAFFTVVRHDDLNELIAGCFDPALRRRVTGTMAGLAPTDASVITVGTGFMAPGPTAAAPAISLTIPQSGPVDLVALRSAVGPQPGVSRLSRILLQRRINPPDNGSLGVIDFGGPDAFAPESTVVTVSGLDASEQLSLNSNFFTPLSAIATLGTASQVVSASLPRVPAARLAAGDVHQFQATATTQTPTTSTTRGIISQVSAPGATSALSLPALLTMPVLTTVSAAPYLRTRFQLARQADFSDFWFFTLSQSGRTFNVQLGATYVGTSASIDYTIPDLSGVDGWQNAWMPVAGVQTVWQALGSSFVRVDGAAGRVSNRGGVITP